MLVLTVSLGCGRLTPEKKAAFEYKFKKGASRVTETKTAVNLHFSKLSLPAPAAANADGGSPAQHEKVVSPQPSLVPEEITELVRQGKLKSAGFECRMRSDQMTAEVHKKEEYADIYARNELVDFRLQVNGLAVPSGGIVALIGGMTGEGEIIKRDRNGGLRSLPRIMGLAIPNSDDPYLGRLMEYIRNAPSYPAEPMSVGQTWSQVLSILVPVDSLSDGQSKGFIRVEAVNKNTLEKVQKGIAYVKTDLSLVVAWDVTVPEQGRTRLSLTLTGDGYRMFDLKKGWECGMFAKGGVKLDLNAEAREKTGRKTHTLVNADGTFEVAGKLL
jgi:hypothetical protein